MKEILEKVCYFIVTVIERIVKSYHILSHDNRLSWILSVLFIVGMGFMMFLGFNLALQIVVCLI